jgi:hypothetical protein
LRHMRWESRGTSRSNRCVDIVRCTPREDR